MAADPTLWPFGAGGDYSERLDWLTDVPQAATGPTHHRRLRQSPRVQVAFSALEEGRVRRRMESLLRDNSAGWWRVPIAVDACRLSALASAGATELALDTTHARFEAGGYALLQGADPFAVELVQIAAGGVAADALTLVEELASAWPAWTRVTPLRLARLAEFPQVGRFTADASDVIDLAFRLEEALDDAAAIAGDTYRDFPVWPFRPVWTSDPAWVPERVVQGEDDGIGRPFVYDLAGVPQGRTAMQFALDSRAGIVAFRQALFALAGRWQPAWVPSWAADVRIVAAVADGATTVDVEGPLLAETALPDNQRDLRIELRDGTVRYCRVASFATLSPTTERLTLAAAIATGFSTADVLLASWMALSTQDADTNLLRYWTRGVMECELTWRQLVHGL